MNQGGMLKPALIAGVLLGILSALPLIQWVNSCCCAWVIGGGIFAAYLYVRESAEAVTLGRGLALGLLTGVIGGIVSVLMSLPLLYISFANTKVLEELSKSVEHVPDLSPQVRAADAKDWRSRILLWWSVCSSSDSHRQGSIQDSRWQAAS